LGGGALGGPLGMVALRGGALVRWSIVTMLDLHPHSGHAVSPEERREGWDVH